MVCLRYGTTLTGKEKCENIPVCSAVVAFFNIHKDNKKMCLMGESNIGVVIFFDVNLTAKITSHRTHCLITNITFDTVE